MWLMLATRCRLRLVVRTTGFHPVNASSILAGDVQLGLRKWRPFSLLKALQVHNRYRCNTCDRFYERHTCYNRHRSAADPTKLTSLTTLTNPSHSPNSPTLQNTQLLFLLTYASSRQETTANSSKREQRTKTLFLKALILLQSFHT